MWDLHTTPCTLRPHRAGRRDDRQGVSKVPEWWGVEEVGAGCPPFPVGRDSTFGTTPPSGRRVGPCGTHVRSGLCRGGPGVAILYRYSFLWVCDLCRRGSKNTGTPEMSWCFLPLPNGSSVHVDNVLSALSGQNNLKGIGTDWGTLKVLRSGSGGRGFFVERPP